MPIKARTKGDPLEDAAQKQLLNVALLPFICKPVAAMPDVHWVIHATVGNVIPARGADYSCRGRGRYWVQQTKRSPVLL